MKSTKLIASRGNYEGEGLRRVEGTQSPPSEVLVYITFLLPSNVRSLFKCKNYLPFTVQLSPALLLQGLMWDISRLTNFVNFFCKTEF